MQRSLLLCALTGIALGTQAQFFVEMHGNYRLPIGGYGMMTHDDDKVHSELVNFGRGAGGGLVLGVMLSEHMGLEGRFTYVSGTEQELHSGSTTYPSVDAATYNWQSTYLLVEPAVRVSTGTGAFKGYLAAGPSLAFGPQLSYASDHSYTYVNPFDPMYSYTRTDKRTEEYEGGMGWGAFGALGFTWSNGGPFGLFAEVQATALSWSPQKCAVTDNERMVYGSGMVETENTTEEIEFEDEYNIDEENRSTKLFLPMSTWGMRAGVRFTFGQ